MYTFAVENYADVYPEAKPLMQLHWEEIAKNKQLLHLNPDERFYGQIGDTVLITTARLAGVLVGYFVWFMVRHPHYQHVMTAEEDIHYLHPDHRRGMAGYLLMKAAREHAKARGAQLLVIKEKIGHEHPAILKRLGFKPNEIVYTLSVGDA